MTSLSLLDQFKGFINTPDIFANTGKPKFNSFQFPEVRITDAVRESLEELDHPRNSVLGKRMESFFEIAIEHSSRYDLIASNIQIIVEKQTLGELDFLLYDNELSKPLHVELVYKLYVYDPKFPSEQKRWIGPNRRDSLYEKNLKLREKQFPLLYKTETSKYLDKYGVAAGEIEQQLCFKAQLFTPESLSLREGNIVNPEGLVGIWYRIKDFLEKDWKKNLFYSPNKKDWSCNPGENNNWISHSELVSQVEILFDKNKAPLVWMKTKNSFYKFFIVWW